MSSTNAAMPPPSPSTPSALKSKKSKKKKRAAERPADGLQEKGNSEHVEEDDIIPEANERLRSIAAADDESGHKPGVADHETEMAITSKEPADATERRAAYEDTMNGDTEARLDALLLDREALREEVTRLRKSLEDIQSKHQDSLRALNEDITNERAEKESAQEQYQSLLGRVNTLRTQLTERLKADAEQLTEARKEIEQLQSQNAALQEENESKISELTHVAHKREEQSKELSTLRNRSTLSQQNWNEERDDLIQREASAREEFENAKQAMQDWEVLAMEERNIRQGLSVRVSELEDEVASQRAAYESAKQQRDTQANTVEGLQKGLQEIQEARKQELREIVEQTQSEITSLRKEVEQAQHREVLSRTELNAAEQERDRLLPLETELKEKNLLIGKLRHEAVILNDHLTKALRQLKRGKAEDVIDRQLVTNHILQFITLSYGDPKKFQILQLIAAMLNWSDEQREQAGLSRPGTSNPSLRNPISSWHRTPSTPSLSAANLGAHVGELGGRKDSIAGLFSDFLESEAEGESSKATSVSGSSRPA